MKVNNLNRGQTRLRMLLALGAILVLNGCVGREHGPGDYLAWLSDPKNGVKIHQETPTLSYDIQYRPAASMALLEAINSGELAPRTTMIDSLSENHFSGLEYYGLRIQSKQSGDLLQQLSRSKDDYYTLLNYVTFEMQGDLAIVAGTDTIPCALFHCERTYGAAPYLDISLGFSRQDSLIQQDRHLLLYSRLEPSPALLEFKFKREQIAKIPKLKL